MKNILTLIAILFISAPAYAQEINDTNDGLTHVVNVELSQDEIYAKVSEWLAETYNSLPDVLKLDSKSKVMVKGIINFNFKKGNIPLAMSANHTLSISIRDNKFKADLSIGDLKSKSFGTILTLEKMGGFGLGYVKKTKEEFKEHLINNLKDVGYSGKKLDKNVKKFVTDKLDERWADYESNYLHLENKTFGMLKSLEAKITTKDDW
tara:strand:- start:68 stop:688 length:621 start_codon:yes stop_codon:yes gene_type:complete